MKRKIVSLFVCFILVTSIFAGCASKTDSSSKKSDSNTKSDSSSSGSEASSSDQVTTAAKKEVLRVGMECAYAPFNWTQSTEELSNGDKAVPIYGTSDYAYGYDVMLAKKLADQLGMDLEVHKVDWSSIVLGMNSGDYDAIIAGMGYTEEREKSVDFTDPYYIRNNVIIMKKDGPYANAKSLADFKGASSTTQIGTIWEQYVPQIPDVKKLTFYETTSEVVMAVSTGTADCAVLDEPTAMSAVLSNPDITYVKFDADKGFTVPKGQSLNVCVAVKEGDKELQDKLDKALDEISWDEKKMVDLMDLAVSLQPLSN